MGHRDQLYYSCQVLIVLCLSLLSPFSLLQVFLVWLHLIFVASFAPTNRTIAVKLWLFGSEFRPEFITEDISHSLQEIVPEILHKIVYLDY